MTKEELKEELDRMEHVLMDQNVQLVNVTAERDVLRVENKMLRDELAKRGRKLPDPEKLAELLGAPSYRRIK